MQEAFGYVIWVVVGLGLLGAVIAFATSGRAYEQIGRGGLSIGDEEQAAGKPLGPAGASFLPMGAPAGSAQEAREREEEIRQMLHAKSARRVARGESALDVDAEYDRLTKPATTVDPQLIQEIRDMVEIRNRRLVKQGKEPLDVEAEVKRRLDEIG